MEEDILEEFIKQYIRAQPTPVVSFLWQGGEPCLMGIDFYETALRLQEKYAEGKQIENSFQTNGLLINEEWCRFFSDNHFLVGISIDGPEHLHDVFRRTRSDKPTFHKVIKAIELLVKHRVEFNTLTVINNINAEHPMEIYYFLKSMGSRYLQFIPVVERVSAGEQVSGLKLVPNTYNGDARVTPWSVEPLKFGRFMSAIFDEWVKKDVGSYFVQLFDSTLANRVGEIPGVCMYAPVCGHSGIIEHNGDVYSCDHFVFPEYYLGNILKQDLTILMNSTRQQLFGQDKFSQLPVACKECRHLTLCYGECPKKRFAFTSDGEPGLNYLCEGYKYFFSHVEPFMDFMAGELRNKRSPANIMSHFRT